MSTELSAPPQTAAAQRLAAMLGVLLVLIGLTVAACFLFQPAASISEAGVVMHWPDRVLDYTGTDQEPSEGELKLMPPDTQLAKKLYRNPSGEALNAQIVLSGVEHRSIHRPEICLRGQGWNVRSGSVESVPLKSGRNLDVMVLDITRPARTADGKVIELPALYAYFFVSKDAETPRHFDRIAITNLDLLFHNKAHRWAYVIAMANVLKGLTPGGKSRDETLQMIKDFLREAAPDFLKSEMASPPSTN